MNAKITHALAVLALVTIASPAFAAVPNANPGAAPVVQEDAPTKSEAERINALRNAKDEIDFLDNANLDEIAEAYGRSRFPKIQFDPARPTPEQVANAQMVIKVSLSQQRLQVNSGKLTDSWNITSGRAGKETTPGGPFFVQSFSPNHVSSLYPINKKTGVRGGAWMGNTMFHNGDEAFHATREEYKLGRRASSGCIRSSIVNQNRLYRAAQYYYDNFGSQSVVIYIRP